MKNKKFDCVKLQHDGAEKIFEQTRNMTVSEEISYWQNRSEELRRLRQLRKSRHNDPKAVSQIIVFRQAEAA